MSRRSRPGTWFGDPRFAASTFGMDNPVLQNIPRHKFLFWVRFVRPPGIGGRTPYGDWNTGVSFRVKTFDKPKYSVQTETLNSYNKKRVIQNRVEYQPVSIRFYDTLDDAAVMMIHDYMTFYYADFRKPTSSVWKHDQTDETVYGGDWGFAPAPMSPEDSCFFERIEIYTFGGGLYSRYDLVRPKISSVEPDILDYSDTNSTAEIGITVQPEGVIMPVVGEPLTPEIGSMLGLDRGQYAPFFSSIPATAPPKPVAKKPEAELEYFRQQKPIQISRTDASGFPTPPRRPEIASGGGRNFGGLPDFSDPGRPNVVVPRKPTVSPNFEDVGRPSTTPVSGYTPDFSDPGRPELRPRPGPTTPNFYDAGRPVIPDLERRGINDSTLRDLLGSVKTPYLNLARDIGFDPRVSSAPVGDVTQTALPGDLPSFDAPGRSGTIAFTSISPEGGRNIPSNPGAFPQLDNIELQIINDNRDSSTQYGLRAAEQANNNLVTQNLNQIIPNNFEQQQLGDNPVDDYPEELWWR